MGALRTGIAVVALCPLFACQSSATQVKTDEQASPPVAAAPAPPPPAPPAPPPPPPPQKQKLPASLAALYPPKVEKPLFYFMMLELSNGFDSVLADAQQGDFEGAKGSFQRFAGSWEKVGHAVPEWAEAFSPDALSDLRQAVEKGDQKMIFASAEKLGARCHGCHANRMAEVQYKYRWPDFDKVTVKQEKTGQEVTFSQIMQGLAITMTGIGNDLQQGQQANALANARAFKAQFALLQKTCDSCHNTERHYFVDRTISSRVAELEKVVASKTPQPEKLGQLMQAIGSGSCGGCHMVHMPAGLAQHRDEDGD